MFANKSLSAGDECEDEDACDGEESHVREIKKERDTKGVDVCNLTVRENREYKEYNRYGKRHTVAAACGFRRLTRTPLPTL